MCVCVCVCVCRIYQTPIAMQSCCKPLFPNGYGTLPVADLGGFLRLQQKPPFVVRLNILGCGAWQSTRALVRVRTTRSELTMATAGNEDQQSTL